MLSSTSSDSHVKAASEVLKSHSESDLNRITQESQRIQADWKHYQTIINYSPRYRYLYVGSANELCLSKRILTWSYSAAEKGRLTKVISGIGVHLLELYSQSTGGRRSEVLRLAAAVERGLTAIAQDHQGGSYEFIRVPALQAAGDLSSSRARLEKIAAARIEGMRVEDRHQLTPFSFIELPKAKIVRQDLLALFRSYYGLRLANHLFEHYISDDQQNFTAFQVGLLVAAAAADVQESDLIALHKRQGGSMASFRDLDPAGLRGLLAQFRSAPGGKPILDYIHIPVDHDKGTVTDKFLDGLAERSLKQRKLKIAISRLADMESVELWAPRRHIRLSVDDFQGRLKLLKSDGPKALHPDPYLGFSEFVGMVGAALELGNHLKESEHLLLLKPLISYLEAPRHWSTKVALQRKKLLEMLRVAQSKKQWDSAPFLKAFEADGTVSEELRDQLRMPEFFARKVAYIHGQHTQKGAPVQKLRGTIFPVYEGDEKVLYQIHHVYADGGFIFQTLLPMDPARYVKAKKAIPAVLTFQGTNFGSWASAKRDLDRDPGYSDWAGGKGIKAVQQDLMRVTSKVQQQYPEARFDLLLTGHSLGASDAQNAAALLSEQLVKQPKWRSTVSTMNLQTFSAPGCPEETMRAFAKSKARYPHKFKPVVHSFTSWDIVTSGGSYKVGLGTEGLTLISAKTPVIKGRSHENIVIRHTEYLYASDSKVRLLTRIAPDSRDHRLYTRGVGAGSSEIFGKVSCLVQDTLLK